MYIFAALAVLLGASRVCGIFWVALGSSGVMDLLAFLEQVCFYHV